MILRCIRRYFLFHTKVTSAIKAWCVRTLFRVSPDACHSFLFRTVNSSNCDDFKNLQLTSINQVWLTFSSFRAMMNLRDESESPVCETLDLSGQGLKKLSRCPSDADISTLIVDDNELQRLDNLDSYHRITKVWWKFQ